MFSGLVAAVGRVVSVVPSGSGRKLEVSCSLAGEPLSLGESIAVDGACLTVARQTATGFAADVSPETVARTTLKALRPGQPVNLERALRPGDRLGGHLVLGHVDATAPVVSLKRLHGFATLRVHLPAELGPEVAVKGSVTVDGVSLTVSALGESWFEVALIPTTLESTTLGGRRPGERVNLETDILAKYVRRALGQGRTELSDLLGGLLGAED